MKLPKVIVEKMDEVNPHKGTTTYQHLAEEWATGFQACYDVMLDMGPEFDNEATSHGIPEHYNGSEEIAFKHGARTQHTLMRSQIYAPAYAKIAELEATNTRQDEMLKGMALESYDAGFEIIKLKAKLEIATEALKKYQNQSASVQHIDMAARDALDKIGGSK